MTSPAELHTQIGRIVRGAFNRIESFPQWERAAADTVIQLPGLQAAFAAQDRLAAELAHHVGEPWAEGSSITVCPTCRAAWPCGTYQTLSGENHQ